MANKNPSASTRWKPGQSGNPGGQTKLTLEAKEFRDKCREASPEAFGVIIELMTSAKDQSIRLQAAKLILERAYGKPAQSVELTGEGGTKPILELIINGAAVNASPAP